MKHKHLADAERLEIGILLGKGYSLRDIGKALVRDHTSIGREIKRNSVKGAYNPHAARIKARIRRRNSKYQGMKIESNSILKSYVIRHLEAHWTPEEISGRLKEEDKSLPYVSAKGIYRWLYSAYGQKYCFFLPKKRFKPKRKRLKKKTKRHLIPNRIGIENRPKEASERLEFGHFEVDTMVSGKRTKSKAAVSVACERKARYSRLRKIPNLKPKCHNNALKKMSRGLKISTFTWDNGIENRNHEELITVLNIQNYFCNPYHSWEKGTVENTIGRIRRFIPKGADISVYSNEDIQKIEDWLNHTPRKCLKYKTPYEIMKENLRFISSHPSGAIEG